MDVNYNSYQNYQRNANNSSYSNQGSRVSFFNLRNDGDEAIVRFPYKSNNEFDGKVTHIVQIGKAFKKINCLRGPGEPLDKCPLCEANERLSTRFFVKLIRYDQTANGVEMQPCIWDRPYTFANTLNEYIQEYGDLSQMVFKIKRHGGVGDQQTTYDVIPANVAIYKPEIYKIDFSALVNYDLSRFFCLEKTADEMRTFLSTGNFPLNNTSTSNRESSALSEVHQTESMPHAFNTVPQNQFNNSTQVESTLREPDTPNHMEQALQQNSNVSTPRYDNYTQSNVGSESTAQPSSPRPRRYIY